MFLLDRLIGARGQRLGRGGAPRHRYGVPPLSFECVPAPSRAVGAGADADMGHVAELRGLVRGSDFGRAAQGDRLERSEEHTSELPSLMRISYAVFCLKKQNIHYLFHPSIAPTYSHQDAITL